MKKKYILIVMLSVLCTLTSYAQITIGSGDAPNVGALLDLKESSNLGNGANSTKGLGMPRVALSSLSDLSPMLPIGYDKAVQDPLHTGMIVYNITTDSTKNLVEGLYVWEGGIWSVVSSKAPRVSASNDNITIDKDPVEIEVAVIPASSVLKVTVSGVEDSSEHIVTKVSDGRYRVVFARATLKGGIKKYVFAIEDQECISSVVTVNTLAKPRLDIGKGIILIGENEEFDTPFVTALGGSEEWEIVGFSPSGSEVVWGTNAVPSKKGKNLFFKTGALPSSAARDKVFFGWIDVKHKDEELVSRIIVRQSKSYTFIPKSDYMIIRFQALKGGGSNGYNDLDGVARITNTKIPMIEGAAVGYGNDTDYINRPIALITVPKGKDDIRALQYGGDNITGGFESSLVYTRNLNEEILNDRGVKEFYIDLYAAWFIHSSSSFHGKEINIEIDLWVGGEISINDQKVFINTGGIQVGKTIKKKREVPRKGESIGAKPGGYLRNYTPLGRIIFDRETESVLFLDEIPPASTKMLSDEVKK